MSGRPGHSFDVIVVGGGHNGLIASAYLARAGLRVAIIEARESLGGPCGTYEFMPGYRVAITNSPGSFEPRFIQDLELEKFGLAFVRTDPTVLHCFPDRHFIGWRDGARVAEQMNRWAPGEADRYFGLLASLEDLARHLGVSMFAPSPDLATLAKGLPRAQARLFQRVFLGSLRQLLDEELRSDQAKAILAMLALNATLAPPSAPGTAVGLMMRPISLASTPAVDAHDPRRAPLRGSTGLPIGGMGAIIDALEAFCVRHGAIVRKGTPVARILQKNGKVVGIVAENGDEYHAPVVISAINPRSLFSNLLDEGSIDVDLRHAVSAVPMRGSAFKIALALDGLPAMRGIPEDADPAALAGVQFRVGPSIDYIERAVADGLAGRTSRGPIIWGMMPSVTSPGVAPPGRHLLSLNVWHAPYTLSEGSWPSEEAIFGQRCIEALKTILPDIEKHIIDRRYIGPVEMEAELGLVHSNITHGDMLPGSLFGARPHPALHDYRTPLRGLYLSGGGTWPGGYVTGIPGFNTSQAVLADLAGQLKATA